MRGLFLEDVDWDGFLWLAARHRLLPLVHKHVNHIGSEGVPADVSEALREAFVENAGQMLRLTGELSQLVKLFQSRGLLAVSYKGPPLALRLYGSLALRQTGDLDIVVRQDAVPAARALLLDHGYRPRIPLSPTGERFQLRARKSEVFEQKRRADVELHWGFTDRFFAVAPEFADLAARREHLSLGGTSIPVFAGQDLLLLLCIHGAKHCWDRLEWICGVAELSAFLPDTAWDGIVRQARGLGSHRILFLGLRLARELLEAPLPPRVVALIEAQSWMDGLIPSIRGLLFEDEANNAGSLFSRDLIRYRLVEGPRSRLRFLVFRLTMPDPSGWILLPLGGRVLPVHALTLPFRRAAKSGARAIRRFLPSSGAEYLP